MGSGHKTLHKKEYQALALNVYPRQSTGSEFGAQELSLLGTPKK